MKQFIKTRLRESLLEEEQLNEFDVRKTLATGMMALGTMGAAKAQTAPATPAPTTQTTPAPEVKKTKYGSTPEQRAAAKIKREGQRKINFDNFVMGAYQRANKISGLIELVSDDELKSGCTLADKEEADYIKGNSNDYPKIIYRELKDGRKLKINIKKYQRYIEQHKNDKDVPLDGLNTAKDLKNAEKSNAVDGPSFFDKINPFKERNGCIYSDEDKSGVKK